MKQHNMDTQTLHRCGQCMQTFESEQFYLEHVCPTTGVLPTHPLSMGNNYMQIQANALQRGANAARYAGDEETAQSTEAHMKDVLPGVTPETENGSVK